MRPTPNNHISYRSTAIIIIFAFAVLRGIVAFSMELGTDEAYYWLYSQNIKWNYFDHPPLVALWIRLFTADLWLQDIEGFVRLGSVVGCGLASWAMYQACAALHSAKAGLFGVCLYNASLFTSITAGIFIMPDTPQMVYYTFSLWALVRVTKNETSWRSWVLFAAMSGLCIMSKVYGVVLWTGLALYVFLRRKNWLARPHMYVAGLLTAAIASPILIWNLQHDFLGYRFHTNRFETTEAGLDLVEAARELLHQLLYNNPVNVVLAVAALVAFGKGRTGNGQATEALWIYNFTALPLALLMLVLSLFRDMTLPHWSGPAYVALIPLSAIYLCGLQMRKAKMFVVAALSGLLIFIAGWQYIIHFAPAVVTETDDEKNTRQFAKDAVSRLFSGFKSFQLLAPTRGTWQPAGGAFFRLYQKETASGVMEKNSAVVCYNWWGAHIEYYFCYPNNISMIGLGRPNDLHEYLFTNAERKDSVNVNTAYCILPVADNYDVAAMYAPYYLQIGKPTLITVKRKGRPNAGFYVYRLRGWKNKLPMMKAR